MASRATLMVRRTYYQISLVSLAVAIVWVGTGIYRAMQGTVKVDMDAEILKAVNPVIDETTLASISARNQLSTTAVEQAQTIIATPAAETVETPTPSPTPSSTEAPNSTISAEPEEEIIP